MDESARDALDSVAFLAASPSRLQILDALAAEPSGPRRLEESLEIPRSTLHRNLSALVDRRYVDHSPTENEYDLTTTGEIVRDVLSETISTVERAESLGPFVEHFPVDLPISVDELASCDLVVSDPESPFDPVSTVKKELVSGESISGFLPAINPLYVDALRTSLEKDVQIEVIAPPHAYDAIASDDHVFLERVTAVPHVRLYESSAVPEYAVGFVDETALLGAFDEHMRTHSVLRSDARSSIWEWARRRYEHIKETANRFDGER